MKCIAAVVMMVLAVVATSEASWAPLAYSTPYTTLVQNNAYARYEAAPWGYAAAPAVSYAAYNYHPTAYVHQPAVPVAVYAQQEARYLAANRGAVHDAPLPGHTVSQQSLNLAPAPGTF
ncbi:adult cuticle protein 1-like [Ochlerotatus camptorhynchus]|uniref:adult cuticle protein 1-like n=1 Tax=Ochlerotatus camptorhynchus TaxID=644619 RepID=UPI0031D6079E